MPENLLSSFSIIKRGRTTFYVKNKYKDVLLNLDIDSLRKEAIEKGDIRSGREPHAVIHIPELSEERIIIRHSRHGGLFGYIAGDIFCKGNRFINELIASETAIEKGVNTAEIIAVIKHRAFGPFYHIDVLSKEIPDSLDLVEFLTNPQQRLKFTERKNIIEVVAQTIRKMHDAGLYHTDLHLKNILIQYSTTPYSPPSQGGDKVKQFMTTPQSPPSQGGDKGVVKQYLFSEDFFPSMGEEYPQVPSPSMGEGKGGGDIKAYIIDMDKAKTMNVVSTKLRVRNLSRLDRSVEKLKALAKLKIETIPSKTDKLRLFKAYTGCDAEMKQYIKMPPRSYRLHRLLWRLSF